VSDAIATIELDAQYRAIREQAAVVDRPGRAAVGVTGAESADYLQGQLSNDVEHLEPGEGRYATLLDRKGHVQADPRALRIAPGDYLLLTEGAAGPPLQRHLATYKIGREVEVVDRGPALALLSVLGPRAPELAGAEGLAPEHAHREVSIGGLTCRAVATDLGVDLLCAPSDADRVRAALLDAGAEPASEDAAEIVRVESGRPRFGHELSDAVMPAEAGIVDRAVDFGKGCYIGQEPVARLHYRGRPNRILRGLRLGAPAEQGAPIALGERDLGRIGTACVSPALGPIALAIVRREAEPGSAVEVGGSGVAEVGELPFRDQARAVIHPFG
jgi:tRNA-modifying protein YgfZ